MSKNKPVAQTTKQVAQTTIDVGTASEIETGGPVVVTDGTPVPIVVYVQEGKAFAVDNRCPHMGFPLHRGTVKDGILTCHWHHARFEMRSGCTFDLFADDVDAYPVQVRDGRVLLTPTIAGRDAIAAGLRRLQDGMEQNIRLITAKAVVALISAGADPKQMARAGGLFGVRRRRDGWAMGMTIMSAMANVADHLQGEDRIGPYYHGLTCVAIDCAGQPPRILLRPLETDDVDPDALKRWFRDLVEVRNADGAERCLRTAIADGWSDGRLADLIVSAATDHFYLDTGHVVDFINKAFELLDRIGWDEAGDVLTSLVGHLCRAQRSEETNAWRSPVDLKELLLPRLNQLGQLMAEANGSTWQKPDGFIDALLGEEPAAIVEALDTAVSSGATPLQLAGEVAYAAALRVARFHVQNEFIDWIGVLHTFSYANALQQLLKRHESADLLRGVYHGALRIYLDRFLNVPPARLPSTKGATAKGDGEAVLTQYLDLLNRQQQVDEAGRLVYDYVAAGHDTTELFGALAESLVREDAEFHSYQMLEAAIRQHAERSDEEERRHVLVAAARYLAAHAPTQRSMLQTLRIALRLHRGDPVFEEEE